MLKHLFCHNLRRYSSVIVVLASLSCHSATGQETAAPPPVVKTDAPAETIENTPAVKTDAPAETIEYTPAEVNSADSATVEPPAATETHEPVGEATESESAANGMVTDAGETQLRFSFSYAPWKDVLDWFATQADCSLLMEAPPHGTFNYTDRRSYTPGEAIDVINSVLLTKGYTLVRRQRMLILVNLEDGIPPNLVSQVAAEDLDERGEFELVSSLFPIQRLTPEEAEEEISKLLGPQGSLVVLPKSGQVMVTETAGKLRAIRKMISNIETPSETGGVKITQLPLQHIGPDEAMAAIRQIMGIAEEEFATEDESLRLSVDSVGRRLLVKATPDALAEVTDILNLVDVALEEAPITGGIETVPQLEVYSISNADPTAVLQVMQTLMAGLPDVRLALDPKTNNLVALARPSQHETIQATLRQMQQEFSQIEVIQLQVLDPETAKLAVQSLFGITEDDEEDQTTGPRVDVNLTTNQLLVRGTSAEIERIRSLLKKMGETGDGPGVANLADRGNIRMLPITGASAQALLERAQLVWPAIGRNRIQTVTPSAAVDAMGHR